MEIEVLGVGCPKCTKMYEATVSLAKEKKYDVILGQGVHAARTVQRNGRDTFRDVDQYRIVLIIFHLRLLRVSHIKAESGSPMQGR